jgi:hypothetical protein
MEKTMYKKIQNSLFGNATTVERLSDQAFIPFDPANTDYQQFKAQINADEAQLQDAEGNTMTPEQAKTYVATLP